MFNKIYYINLKRRPERNKHVLKELKRFKLDSMAERIEAIDGKTLDIQKLPDTIITQSGKTDALAKNAKLFTPLTVGGVGCALSHKSIYDKMVVDNIPSALILEDDVVFDDKFPDKLSTLKRMAPPEYDVIFLGYSSTYYYFKFNEKLVKPTKLYGLFGYIVTQSGAKKLREVFPITQQLDTEIPKHFSSKINAYAVTPELKMISSDDSMNSSRFKTDIQVREGFDPALISANKIYDVVVFMIYVLIRIFFRL